MKIKFIDNEIDTKTLLEEIPIGHLKNDAEVYKTFSEFNNNLFKQYLDDFFELDDEFPNIAQITSFKKLIEAQSIREYDIEFGDWQEDDYRSEELLIGEIEIDFSVTPCYFQIIDCSTSKLEVVKKYLSDYDWRFDIVGFFHYKNEDYIYLLCDEEN